MSNNAPIGVFDSGIGGLTVVRELIKLMPNEDLLYFGDTARTPYGSRQPAEILEFMHQIIRFMAKEQVKIAVVACNTMTALGLEAARHKYPFMLIGVNNGAESALKVTRNNTIGVIATKATIASGKHGQAILSGNPGAIFIPQPCPRFVPLIEQGKLTGQEIEEAVEEYLGPIREAGADAVILGCTHYPLISSLIRSRLGQDVTLIDPAYETAMDTKNMLCDAGQVAGRKCSGTVRLCFSADVKRARKLAEIIIAKQEMQFAQINLQDFS